MASTSVLCLIAARLASTLPISISSSLSVSLISSMVGVEKGMLAMTALTDGEETQLGGPKVSLYPGCTLFVLGCKGSKAEVGGASLEIGESDRRENASAVTCSFPGM
jgi:hypothetical protein